VKEKIAVLMGGRSLEREVSLASGAHVVSALEERGYNVVALDLIPELVATLRSEKPDAVYIALHGKLGEDGTIQEMLEFLGIPYTGPGVLASALAWDKDLSKRILAEAGVAVPCSVALSSDGVKEMGAARALDLLPDAIGGLPAIVKPARQGSALGLARVDEPAGLADAIISALSYDSKVLVEKRVEGVELAVSVLDAGDGASSARALPPVEIVSGTGIFDYHARFTEGVVDYFAPARVTGEQDASARSVAEQVHEVLGCRDVSRTDLIMTGDGVPVVLECNTSPGMTITSLLPMAAEADGISFAELVERLACAALERRR
jgi:D-alanine-D-alanine ligase